MNESYESIKQNAFLTYVHIADRIKYVDLCSNVAYWLKLPIISFPQRT